MRRIGLLLTLVAAMLVSVPLSAAESPSDLLEKGIYTEETVGNLDEAIKIYEEIISQDKVNRRYVAEAQLRLGKCLLKQGKKEQAERTLRTLVNQFKDSVQLKQLVASARKLLPESDGDLKLEPVPWVDGESLELRIKLGGGLEIGDFILTARTAELDGGGVWHLGLNRNVSANPPNLGLSHVVADRRTFRPISSSFKHSLLGNVSAEYGRGEVTIHATARDGKVTTKKLSLDGIFYDNEQGWHLFRRLPLTAGYTADTPVCATFGGGPVQINVEVTGKETVDVPAGKFECFRLFLKPVQQTFWISTDAKRYVVKFEAGGVSGELQSIRQVKDGATVNYKDTKHGFVLTAPADWYFIPALSQNDKPVSIVTLMDPNAHGVNILQAKPIAELKDEHNKSARAWAEHKIEDFRKEKKNFKVLDDSWQSKTIAGQPAISFVAHFVHGEQTRARYHVFMLGESLALSCIANTTPDVVNDLRQQLDTILETYQAPQQ